ncbi:uncharacterized protein A1O5_11648 [Cladophialophora psammophila CBS 110553]|uniref:DUF7702 domain-containing protein n=1 Tax=Cladophialophora psammophila CBS 110553 TaxID=1182543 RepID=W9W5J7_9EURO|nr:uncharacterized protein A1O5_11648 [Cladophialophora psammophila CBS 110553]EXJ63327.1 hypothetical protein A1O5_11648 [Cladophialophora psammophila CBS 110553]
MIQTPAAIALILCIVGATNANDPAEIDSESTVHVGIILYTLVFAALVCPHRRGYIWETSYRTRRGVAALRRVPSATFPGDSNSLRTLCRVF